MIHRDSKTAFFMAGNTANVAAAHTPVKKAIDEKLIPLLKY